MEQLCYYVTSEGLGRGWTSELAAESIRLLWLILQEKGRITHEMIIATTNTIILL